MSYKTARDTHPFIHVYLSTASISGVNSDAFPYTDTQSSSGLTFDSTDKSITIDVSGIYLISYCFNVGNNTDNTGGGDDVFFGVTVGGTTYDSKVDTNTYSDSLKYVVSNTIVVQCNKGDTIKGFIGDRSQTFLVYGGRGATSLSVCLIAPFTS